MQDLIDRAAMNEDTDIEALRELACAISVEGDEPSPRVATDGGRPMTVGWRSPVGGPRYDGEIPGDHVEEWPEDRIQAQIEEHERAEATAGEEAAVRADGGHVQLREGEQRDDDNTHAQRNVEQFRSAIGETELPEIGVGDHVSDREAVSDATMLVVEKSLEDASEYECKGQPLCEYANNEDYPTDDDVVEVVFPDRGDVDIRPLDRFAYPRSRLRLEASIHDRGEE